MLCVEAPEANILVCKGYKCTKNQAPDYILLQNQVISSNNYQQQLSEESTSDRTHNLKSQLQMEDIMTSASLFLSPQAAQIAKAFGKEEFIHIRYS